MPGDLADPPEWGAELIPVPCAETLAGLADGAAKFTVPPLALPRVPLKPPLNPPDTPAIVRGAGIECGARRDGGVEAIRAERDCRVIPPGARRDARPLGRRACETGADWLRVPTFADPVGRAMACTPGPAGKAKPDAGAEATRIPVVVPRGTRSPAVMAPAAPRAARITIGVGADLADLEDAAAQWWESIPIDCSRAPNLLSQAAKIPGRVAPTPSRFREH